MTSLAEAAPANMAFCPEGSQAGVGEQDLHVELLKYLDYSQGHPGKFICRIVSQDINDQEVSETNARLQAEYANRRHTKDDGERTKLFIPRQRIPWADFISHPATRVGRTEDEAKGRAMEAWLQISQAITPPPEQIALAA